MWIYNHRFIVNTTLVAGPRGPPERRAVGPHIVVNGLGVPPSRHSLQPFFLEKVQINSA